MIMYDTYDDPKVITTYIRDTRKKVENEWEDYMS